MKIQSTEPSVRHLSFYTLLTILVENSEDNSKSKFNKSFIKSNVVDNEINVSASV